MIASRSLSLKSPSVAAGHRQALQQPRRAAVSVVASSSDARRGAIDEPQASRRDVLKSTAMLAAASSPIGAFLMPQPAAAVMGMTAGRVPGLSAPDADGYQTYTRPEGKSGGHGIGWSEIPQYVFQVTEGWEEQPVSIADLGGTEIDIRFENKDIGELAVVVAPVLRFMDVGFNAQVTMEDIGPPEKIVEGFSVELWGQPLGEGEVIDTQVINRDGAIYYRWEVKPYQRPHLLMTATATRNRLFIMLVSGSPRQWRKGTAELNRMVDSFRVPQAA